MSKFEPVHPRDLTRSMFLRRAAAAGLAVPSLSFLVACGDDDDAAGGGSGGKDVKLEDLGTVGGAMQILTYAGYEGADAIKPWLKEQGIEAKATAINSQDDVTTKLRSPAFKKADAAQLGVAQVEQYRQLDMVLPIDPAWLPNVAKVDEYFIDLVKDDNGKLTAVPFVWGGLGCNYDHKQLKNGIESWQELIDPKMKGRVAMIDDPVSTVQTGALAVGIREPNKMTKDQLEEVKEFLVKVKANARTVAAGYADIGDLIVAGDVWASFQGWNAVEIFADAKGGTVKTAYPKEGTVAFVDCFIVPKGADNARSSIAFIDHMLSPEMQAYVGNDLASGLVRLDATDKVTGIGAEIFDYDNLQELFKTQFVFALDAPLESDGDVATHEDWVAAWEDVKGT